MKRSNVIYISLLLLVVMGVFFSFMMCEANGINMMDKTDKTDQINDTNESNRELIFLSGYASISLSSVNKGVKDKVITITGFPVLDSFYSYTIGIKTKTGDIPIDITVYIEDEIKKKIRVRIAHTANIGEYHIVFRSKNNTKDKVFRLFVGNDNGIKGITINDVGDFFVVKKNVTTIDSSEYSKSSFTSVLLSNSITTIGSNAFYNSTLTNLVMSNSITNIGNEAFYNSRLTRLVIPDSVTKIGGGAFFENPLNTLVLGNAIITIGAGSFNNSLLTELVIPDSVITIGADAFSKSPLIRLDLGSSVVSIDSNAFRDSLLTELVIPDSVTIIGENVFHGSKATLKSVVLTQTLYDNLGTRRVELFGDSVVIIRPSDN